MKKLKDLIYDYNDIFLAIIIIAIAAAVIFWKVSDIMAYPSFIKDQQHTQQPTDVTVDPNVTTPIDVDPITPPGEDITGENPQGGENQTQDPQPQTPSVGVTKDVTFTVPSGYVGSKIATKLESEGLCKADDFLNAMTRLSAENKLRAGDFKIPAGSTAEDIVKIIANIH